MSEVDTSVVNKWRVTEISSIPRRIMFVKKATSILYFQFELSFRMTSMNVSGIVSKLENGVVRNGSQFAVRK